MKKLLVALFALGTLTANAQTFKDTFDSNSMGWTEISGKDGEAVYGHEIEMYTIEQGEKRDKRQ